MLSRNSRIVLRCLSRSFAQDGYRSFTANVACSRTLLMSSTSGLPVRTPQHYCYPSSLALPGTSTRNMSLFGSFLDSAWNRVDKKRIEEIGPEVAAAEWVMRCGGSVKWKNHVKWTTDYNQIGIGTGPSTKIEAIDATNACINSEGFAYLKGLQDVRMVKLHKTLHIDDASLRLLGDYLGSSLVTLEVTSCGNVSDKGLKELSRFKNLKELHLGDLPGVKNPDDCVKHLKSQLPQCDVTYAS